MRNPEFLVEGRKTELAQLTLLLKNKQNILIEGPVGVGKTFLAQSALKNSGTKWIRVDGDSRFNEQKMTGWFDPQLVLKKGYSKDTFVDGPLVEAMKKGIPLFVNELNRMPENVQNILLPAMDEHRIYLPKVGELRAKEGFLILGTQNPKEFTATHSLSEALLDRFEMIYLEYQSLEEEFNILKQNTSVQDTSIRQVVHLLRATRDHSDIKRGASLRAGLSILQLMEQGLSLKESAMIALPTRIELLSQNKTLRALIDELLSASARPTSKKKS